MLCKQGTLFEILQITHPQKEGTPEYRSSSTMLPCSAWKTEACSGEIESSQTHTCTLGETGVSALFPFPISVTDSCSVIWERRRPPCVCNEATCGTTIHTRQQCARTIHMEHTSPHDITVTSPQELRAQTFGCRVSLACGEQ